LSTFLAQVAAYRSYHQIRENLASWTSKVASKMLTMGGQWEMEWQAKVRAQNGGRAQVKPKNQPERAVLAP